MLSAPATVRGLARLRSGGRWWIIGCVTLLALVFYALPKHEPPPADWSAPGIGEPMTTRCKLPFGTYYTRRFGSPQTPPAGKQICSTGNPQSSNYQPANYEFEYSEEESPIAVKNWNDFSKLPCKYINLGADGNRHLHDPNYFNYVAVQGPSTSDGWGCKATDQNGNEECGDWCVCHDLRTAIPLPDGSVDRIHSEDFMEHIDHEHYPALFKEMYRLLKPGGRVRIGCPDYSAPRTACSEEGKFWHHAWDHENSEFPDGGMSSHRTLTNYALLKSYIEQSPFKQADWLLYYDNLQPGQPFTSKHLPEGAHINTKEHPLPLIEKPIDYTLGVVTRTPRVDCRNNVLKGPHNVMSLVFDLVKEA